jgi:GTP-binding protein
MNFIDTAKITVRAGDGGSGHTSFRKEKFVPKGGPDGGNGGKGGDVILVADPQLATLLDVSYRRTYEAQNGAKGGRSNCTGRSGEDLEIRVPVGTVATLTPLVEEVAAPERTGFEEEAFEDEFDDEFEGEFEGEFEEEDSSSPVEPAVELPLERPVELIDLDRPYQRVIIAKGGRGGRGNSEFVTSINQAPRKAENGRPGEAFTVALELKVLAEVGLVGFPNAGKSTLISSISAAKPKIADYPFTTLVPNLGMVRVGDGQSFTVADIPGLIEGAHLGKGLGHQFLRHVERTSVLVIMIDCQTEDPEEDFHVLRRELEQYGDFLGKKEYLVCLTKTDVLPADTVRELRSSTFVKKHKARLISAVSRQGLDDLVRDLWERVKQLRSGV